MEPESGSSSLVPFRGVRFRDTVPGGLAAALGPPDDIDSSDEARAFVRDRPLNAVRLEIEDDNGELRFRGARKLLDRWRQDGTIDQDATPSYYVYEQTFIDHDQLCVRRGIFGLVPFDAPDVSVLPHEETWEENRQRRLQLLRDLDAGISPVFLIYDGIDTARLLEDIVQLPRQQKPSAATASTGCGSSPTPMRSRGSRRRCASNTSSLPTAITASPPPSSTTRNTHAPKRRSSWPAVSKHMTRALSFGRFIGCFHRRNRATQRPGSTRSVSGSKSMRVRLGHEEDVS